MSGTQEHSGAGMAGEQRQEAVARLVVETAGALRAQDWARVLVRAETALALDPGNAEVGAARDAARAALVEEALAPHRRRGERSEPGPKTPRPSIEWAVARAMALMPMPAVARRIVHVASDTDDASEALARLIESAPAITAEVLRVSNSARYARWWRVSSVREALRVLGFHEVRGIALAACLARMVKHANAISHHHFWSFSLTVGLVTDALARTHGTGHEQAYIAGVLHNIGLLALDVTYPDELAMALRLEGTGRRLHDRQRTVIGFTDAELGARLAEMWGFPRHLVRVMRHHGARPHELEESDQLVGYVIHARRLVRDQGHHDGAEQSEPRGLPADWTIPPLSETLEALGGVDGIKARVEAFAARR